MIATSVRASLTADDMRLAVDLLGGSSAERRRLSQKAMEEGPDALWDDPRLPEALIKERGLGYWADPGHRRPNAINTNDGGRGVYWDDPNGNTLEIITRPYGSGG